MSTDNLEFMAATALRHISRNETIKTYVQQNPPLYSVLLRAASRLIGGETLLQCLETAQNIQKKGFAITIDYMGESTRDATMVQHFMEEFSQVVQAVNAQHLNASLSLDLSHIGLTVDTDLAFHNAYALAQATHQAGMELMISMEGSERTSDIIEIHRRLCKHFDNVGITLQAYLYRTAHDLVSALELPGRIRLVKGAYEEPADLALPRGDSLDTVYRHSMETLLASGHSCSIATHDPVLLDHAHTFIQQNNLDQKNIEFEMLYGVTPYRLQTMRDQGYHTRIYLPYGQEWYLYLCHRLAEYPPGIYQAIADAVGINPA